MEKERRGHSLVKPYNDLVRRRFNRGSWGRRQGVVRTMRDGVRVGMGGGT